MKLEWKDRRFYSTAENKIVFQESRFIESFGDFDEDKDYECMMKFPNNRVVTYYLYHSRHLFRKDDWSFHIHLGKIGTILGNLWDLNCLYTEESIRKAFKDLPTVQNYIFDHYVEGHYLMSDGLDFMNGELTIRLDGYGRDLSEYKKKEIVSVMVRFADKVIQELSRKEIYTDCFVKKPVEYKQSTFSQLPDWLQSTIKVGARIGVKTIAAALRQNVDLPDIDFGGSNIPDIDVPSLEFDFDGNFDFDVDGLDGGFDFDSDGIAFMGNTKDSLPSNANSDGYIPDGSISLTRTISDTTDTFKHYKKDGHDFVLYYGNYIRVDGSGTVTIGGVKYDKK